ncbi:MAG: cell division protein FtsA [Rhodobacterales bacterium]|nr:MAG: cell division protein FtsA [Rhodobacterales bacterium]
MSDLYRAQRAMRVMRKTAMHRGVVAVLDVGTSKIACLVLRFDGADRFAAGDEIGAMAGQSGFRVIGAATTRSRGVRFGEVSTMQETERAVRTVIQAAQKMANLRVDHVIACFSGAKPRSYGLAGQIELHDSVVTEDDVSQVLAACDVPAFGEDREVLHAQPVNFALDHRSGLIDPRGQIGNQLAADMHMLTVDSHVVGNLLHCIKRCDLEVAGLASSAYVSGLSALVEDEQELGAACIDMGGGATGISIFIKKHMIYSDSVELGGDTGDWEHDRRSVSRAELIGIMRPRVEEILEEVRNRLDAAGFDHLPSHQIVLTGGSSQIPGLESLANKILGQQVRLGRPMRVQGLPQAATGPAFASSVGLCLNAARPQDEWWDFDIPAETYPARSLKRAVKWFKDNW